MDSHYVTCLKLVPFKLSVKTHSIEVSKTLAARLTHLWTRVVSKTNYKDSWSGGLDGVTFEFGVGSMHGEVWNPRTKQSPQLLIDLANSLIHLSKQDEDKAISSAVTEVESKAAILEKYLDKHHPKPNK